MPSIFSKHRRLNPKFARHDWKGIIMNDAKIEELLRKAPRPAVPSHLRNQLEANISLLRPASPSRQETGAAPLFARWFPAASFAAFFLLCLAAVGVQTKAVWTLQKENELLRAVA